MGEEGRVCNGGLLDTVPTYAQPQQHGVRLADLAVGVDRIGQCKRRLHRLVRALQDKEE